MALILDRSEPQACTPDYCRVAPIKAKGTLASIKHDLRLDLILIPLLPLRHHPDTTPHFFAFTFASDRPSPHRDDELAKWQCPSTQTTATGATKA
jgi:hypothetical protein